MLIIQYIKYGDWGLGIGGLGIGDWGLGIGPNPQSPIPNPQSPYNHLFKQQSFFIINKCSNLQYIVIINFYYLYFNVRVISNEKNFS